jgi:hydroxymethylpyrimidine/phosphomethylpyrimidine kinase
LLPLATVITPNTYEAGVLLGIPEPLTLDAARFTASALAKRGDHAVLVTGGHLDDPEYAVDLLHDAATLHELRVVRVASPTTHGTGCTLSSAIAALLALGSTLRDACASGQQFVAGAIARGAELTVGRGTGPVNQLGGRLEER